MHSKSHAEGEECIPLVSQAAATSYLEDTSKKMNMCGSDLSMGVVHRMEKHHQLGMAVLGV